MKHKGVNQPINLCLWDTAGGVILIILIILNLEAPLAHCLFGGRRVQTLNACRNGLQQALFTSYHITSIFFQLEYDLLRPLSYPGTVRQDCNATRILFAFHFLFAYYSHHISGRLCHLFLNRLTRQLWKGQDRLDKWGTLMVHQHVYKKVVTMILFTKVLGETICITWLPCLAGWDWGKQILFRQFYEKCRISKA